MGQMNHHPQHEKRQKYVTQIGNGIGDQRCCQGAGQGEHQIACVADRNKEKEQQQPAVALPVHAEAYPQHQQGDRKGDSIK